MNSANLQVLQISVTIVIKTRSSQFQIQQPLFMGQTTILRKFLFSFLYYQQLIERTENQNRHSATHNLRFRHQARRNIIYA